MFRHRDDTAFIIVHRTNREADESSADLKRRQRAQGYLDIGFHYVIRVDGFVEPGREPNVTGLHCPKFNRSSLGICLVGITPTRPQMVALEGLIRGLKSHVPQAEVIGHSHVNPKTECPGFDVKTWWAAVCPEDQHDARVRGIPEDPQAPTRDDHHGEAGR